jgi:lysophospholipase L1-like esterase
LKQRLKQLGSSPRIVNAGVPAEKTAQITQRLVGLLRQGVSCDLIAILAGTNDILALASPEKVFRDIEHLHQLAWEVNAKTVVMTIPSLCLPAHPNAATFEEYRVELNTRLQHFALSNQHRAVFIDVAMKLPRTTEQLWASDGVHMSRQGYETLGQLIAEA